METKKKIIIDTDPGVDDAIALMYACKCEQLDIQLLSIAGGNSSIENLTANALHLCELFDATIPVVQGSKTPLSRPATFAISAQGKYGLGNYTFNHKKLKSTTVSGEACDVLFETLKKNGGKTSIVSIGPMTNLAKLLQKHPDCKKHIKEIIFESGTKEKIYGKPYKSFNVGYDPESAEVVFSSGIPLVMVPMELGHIAYLDKNDIKRFKKTNSLGKKFAKMFKGYKDFHVGNLGAAVHDVCAIYYLTHPELFKKEKAFVSIKYFSNKKNKIVANTGKTNLDDFGFVDIDFSATPNATVCMDLDIASFKQHLFEALEKYQ